MTNSEELLLEKKILEKLDALDAKKKSKDWFSPPMLMAYVAIIGLLGTTAENTISRIKADEEVELGEETQGELAGVFVERIDELATKIDDQAQQQEFYFDAIFQSMPYSQRRKIERFMDTEGRVSIAPEPDPLPVGGGVSTDIQIESDDSTMKPDEAKEATKASAPKSDIFQQLQIQVKEGNSLNFEKVKAAVQDRRKSRE